MGVLIVTNHSEGDIKGGPLDGAKWVGVNVDEEMLARHKHAMEQLHELAQLIGADLADPDTWWKFVEGGS